ncbi:hypothetical protein [Vibrio coralliilyticus]|uniref:hypothetical protein n=1 Tax=Vibrio coralliilyticus TaxID=190893 RepID=UPI00148DE45B|nr:hypothetical protein [Vibrio coralliilyticus]NOI30615.1 hypothetical protein [Vibrio coralliilyticus]NOI49837.1 hypothetical protein [Vibrio coralliilyticus]
MKRILLLTAILFSASSMADITCYGTVKNVLQYGNGSINVYMSYRGDYTVMCNIETHWKGVNPEACQGMLSVLLTAQSTGKNIATYYNGDQYTCANLPTYSATPGPVYVGIIEK